MCGRDWSSDVCSSDLVRQQFMSAEALPLTLTYTTAASSTQQYMECSSAPLPQWTPDSISSTCHASCTPLNTNTGQLQCAYFTSVVLDSPTISAQELPYELAATSVSNSLVYSSSQTHSLPLISKSSDCTIDPVNTSHKTIRVDDGVKNVDSLSEPSLLSTLLVDTPYSHQLAADGSVDAAQLNRSEEHTSEL